MGICPHISVEGEGCLRSQQRRAFLRFGQPASILKPKLYLIVGKFNQLANIEALGLGFLNLTETLVQGFKNAGEEKFSLRYPHFYLK